MAETVRPIPERYHSLTPYVIVSDASRAIAFYKEAFDATEVERHDDAHGRTEHAEVKIGDSVLMMSEEYAFEGLVAKSPSALPATSMHLYLYLEDVDAAVERAVAAGATLLVPIQDQWWGDRMGGVKDPFGHVWWLATHTENLSEEEAQARFLAQSSVGSTS